MFVQFNMQNFKVAPTLSGKPRGCQFSHLQISFQKTLNVYFFTCPMSIPWDTWPVRSFLLHLLCICIYLDVTNQGSKSVGKVENLYTTVPLARFNPHLSSELDPVSRTELKFWKQIRIVFTRKNYCRNHIVPTKQ